MVKKNSTTQSRKVPSKQRLGDYQKSLVLDCIVMRLTEKESLAYLKDHKYPIKEGRFYEIKKVIKENNSHQINKIALENGFAESHMERITTLRTIEREHWINYNKEKEPIKKSTILKNITELQVYLSSAYDTTKAVIREQAELKKKFKEEPPHQ